MHQLSPVATGPPIAAGLEPLVRNYLPMAVVVCVPFLLECSDA